MLIQCKQFQELHSSRPLSSANLLKSSFNFCNNMFSTGADLAVHANGASVDHMAHLPFKGKVVVSIPPGACVGGKGIQEGGWANPTLCSPRALWPLLITTTIIFRFVSIICIILGGLHKIQMVEHAGYNAIHEITKKT